MLELNFKKGGSRDAVRYQMRKIEKKIQLCYFVSLVNAYAIDFLNLESFQNI